MNELYEKYPQFKNVKGVDLHTYMISPVNVESQHDGKKYTMTKQIADKFANELEHTALLYAECDDKLPKDHKDYLKKRKVIGSALKGYVAKDELGIDYLMGDYVVYTDSEPDIIENIKKFKNDVSTSWEIHQALTDTEGNIIDGSYGGTSIMDKAESAYRHHALLVASKTGESEVESKQTVNIVYDDIIKQVVGENYNTKITTLEIEIENVKREYELKIKEKEDMINGLNEENSSLRELNLNFSKLMS